ncbi:MAG TPA: DNA polymerase III subunit alpha [Candidatus Saccharimonadales bacterium]|nr:DNA polymerase III subunit alpha [Candidatus Saccharimonadales bacterium]
MPKKEKGSVKNKDVKSSDFVHLHNHTEYSLLDGLTKVPKLVESVKEMGMDAVAITDHGTLSGVIDLYDEAKKKSIKPIIGVEAYIAPRKLSDKDPAFDKQYYHIILLAMDNTGYQNLMKLSTIAHLEGFYYKPRIDRETLEKYSDGIIAISGCISSELGDALRQEQYEQAVEVAKWYKKIFGDRYYIEIQDHGHKEHPSSWGEQTKVNKQSFKIAEQLKIKTVITGDAHYLKKDDQEAHEILLCVQTGSFLSDENRMSLANFELNVADPKDIIARWGKTHPDSITNTKEVADRCNVEIKLGNYLIPKFDVPKGETEKSYLEKLTFEGLVRKYTDSEPEKTIANAKKQLPANIIKRAEYELGIINRMGFSGYFLIVSDFIQWGKDKGIIFGPGRGSGAGSIVAYGLRITELDPLEYGLLFERFLNPDRISMPDFDIDIQDTRRDEVINYCVKKYGEEKVANIVTFGRMAARNAVRDVARVLQVPYAEADRLAKMIPPPVQGRHIPLEKSLNDNSDLKREYKENETAKRVFDLAIKLEGTIRSHGVHAAGVVIAPDEIVKFTPLEMAQKGVVSTQYSMGPIEEIGLLKIDFLGLSNLTIIKNSLKIIKKVYGEDIDISNIPLDDKKTFELFQRGDTTGVFQFESAGMKRYLKELKPNVLDDLIAMNALYRPGPMQWIDDFIARKHGKKKIEYMHPKLESALKETYGVLVYQEQFMQISKDLCGFSGGQADTLRKAVGKKISSLLKKVKPDFIEGGIKHSGADRKMMEKFWDELEEFANYCFNKAHSACYASIAYQTAYLKAHYPAAFMAALMTSDYDDSDRLAIEISECRSMGIDVLPPDINESYGRFAVIHQKDKESIRFGMNAIKNVGTGVVDEIIKARKEIGGFTNLEQFLKKFNSGVINKKALDSLVKSGAFDSLGDRGVLVENIENMLAYASRYQKQASSGQTDLFGSSVDEPGLNVSFTLKPVDVDNGNQNLKWERELLGIYLSSHPLSEYEEVLRQTATPIKELANITREQNVKIGGSITEKKEIITKTGQKMAFIKLADMESEIELIAFPGVLAKSEHVWERDKIILVGGKISSKDKDGNTSEAKIIVETVEEINLDENDYEPPKPKRLYIRLQDTGDEQKLSKLKETIDVHPGDMEIVLVVGPDRDRQIIKIPSRVEPNDSLLSELDSIFGKDTIKLH